MSENVGMELDHTETWIDTAIDDKKVTDVAKVFDGARIAKEVEDFCINRKQRLEEKRKNRTVESVCKNIDFLNSEKDDVNSYYTSYDDHLKQLNDEIENQKAAIERGLYRLKLLEIKEKNLIAEAEAVTSENFELPNSLKIKGFEDLIKEHIFHKHPKLIGDYYGEHRYSSHAGPLNLETIYDKDGNIVKVRCMECYRKFMKEAELNEYPTKDDGELDKYDHVGGK